MHRNLLTRGPWAGRAFRTAAIAALGVSAGCSSGTPSAPPLALCSAPQSIAVVVTVTDSVSGASIADGARGAVRAGTYLDSLRRTAPPAILVGGSRLGIFVVTVEHDGYRVWTRGGVVVSQQGPCGNVIPVQLTARMQPLP